MSIYDKLLDRAVGDISLEEFNGYIEEHKFDDIRSIPDSLEGIEFSDYD